MVACLAKHRESQAMERPDATWSLPSRYLVIYGSSDLADDRHLWGSMPGFVAAAALSAPHMDHLCLLRLFSHAC